MGIGNSLGTPNLSRQPFSQMQAPPSERFNKNQSQQIAFSEGGTNQRQRLHRTLDDASLNERIRNLQFQKTQINELARKYDLEDNSSITSLSLLTILNPQNGHHHASQFENPGQHQLQGVDRAARQREYHEMTNARRKKINARVQVKRAQAMKELEAQMAEEAK